MVLVPPRWSRDSKAKSFVEIAVMKPSTPRGWPPVPSQCAACLARRLVENRLQWRTLHAITAADDRTRISERGTQQHDGTGHDGRSQAANHRARSMRVSSYHFVAQSQPSPVSTYSNPRRPGA